jgi:lysophospholipase L1-like esterase
MADLEREQADRRRGRGRWLAVLVSSVVALAAAELVARRLFGVPLEERLPIVEVRANRTRGYEMVPDRDHYTYLEPVHVNHLGLRGPDLPRKESDEVRVLCLGDSLVYGQGVSDADTIPDLLAAEFAARAEEVHRSVRVVNGGLRGYDTIQEIALLEELGPRIEPDLVVLFWYPNDLERPRVDSACASLERSGPVAYDTDARMEGSAVVLWHLRQIARRSALLMRLRHIWTELASKPLPPAEIEKGFQRLDASLATFSSWVRARGIPAVVATMPDSVAVESTSSKDAKTDDELRLRVRRLAEAHGIPTVDPTPELRLLRAELGRLPVLPYDGHYDGRANQVVARRVAPVLRELLPTRL